MNTKYVLILKVVYLTIIFIFLNNSRLLAGTATQVRYFDTYDGGIILSTDPAGIAYNGNHLFITDSEINENGPPPPPGYFRGDNIFEINLLGSRVYGEYVTALPSDKLEPTGICYNPIDGYFYITNDLTRTLYQYEFNGVFSLNNSWDLREAPFDHVGFRIEDPEGIGVNPNTGLMYIADGNGGHTGENKIVTVEVSGSSISRIASFSVDGTISDPEGIAYHEETGHLFIVSSPEKKIFEYDVDGNYFNEYDISGLEPSPKDPQGLTFAPNSINSSRVSIYIADGGIDESPQSARIYEVDLDYDYPSESPMLMNPIPDQQASVGITYNYTFPANTFIDRDGSHNLSYMATLSDDSALPGWLSFTGNTRTFNGTPRKDDIGIITIKVTAMNNLSASASDEFDLEVVASNNAPVVLNPIPDQHATEDIAFSYRFPNSTFEDVDPGDKMRYNATLSDNSALPDWLDFERGKRKFSGTPRNGDVGTIVIKVTATDRSSNSVSDEFELEVVNANDAPVVANPIPDQHATEDIAFSYTFPANTFNDIDVEDNLTYRATLSNDIALPGWLSFSGTTRTFNGTPRNEDVGVLNIRVIATDLSSVSAFDEFNLVIDNSDGNDPPVLSAIPDVYFSEDDSLSLQISELYAYVEDPDTPVGELIFGFIPGEYVYAHLDSPRVVLMALSDWYGMDTTKLIVSDGEFSDTAEVAITVLPINDAPVFKDLPDTVEFVWSSESVLIMADYVDDKDLPNDSLRWQFEVSNAAIEHEFDAETSELTLTAPDFVGVVTLYCAVSDDSSASASDSLVVNVIAEPLGINNFANRIPTKYELHQNYPNPFNPITHIRFGLPKAGEVKIVLYTVLGQKVLTLIDDVKPAGYHVVTLDASSLSTGIYFYQIQTNNLIEVKKLILMQ